KEEPLPPSTLNVQLPPAIDAVVRKALAKRADDRFESAQAFSVALRAAIHASGSTRDAATASDADATMPNLAAMAGAQPVASRAHAKRQTTAIAIVAAIAAIGIAAWWLFPRE